MKLAEWSEWAISQVLLPMLPLGCALGFRWLGSDQLAPTSADDCALKVAKVASAAWDTFSWNSDLPLFIFVLGGLSCVTARGLSEKYKKKKRTGPASTTYLLAVGTAAMAFYGILALAIFYLKEEDVSTLKAVAQVRTQWLTVAFAAAQLVCGTLVQYYQLHVKP